ncbi:hypothetical protein HHL27_18580 [Novosphingobium sp. TW-4]|uniref:Uncharacterized protein n=1 Tax=Novosphingobium olei TaxID=2728851 RepID=A0A7Y0BSN7_9SPHN|nr:hypothetical protein [Novosphingobium olei]
MSMHREEMAIGVASGAHAFRSLAPGYVAWIARFLRDAICRFHDGIIDPCCFA